MRAWNPEAPITEPDDTLRGRLAWHIAEAEKRCAQQIALIEHLRANGEDPGEAESLLEHFRQMLAAMRGDAPVAKDQS